MSQSTTRASSAPTAWMDLDNERIRAFRPDLPRVTPDRSVQLMRLRKEQVGRRLAALRASGRTPRIALYARTVNGQTPVRSLTAARSFAERMAWQVGPDQEFTDCLSLTEVEDRLGWLRMKQRLASGFLDGIVAITRSDVSTHLNDYERELDWLTLHGGFIALVHAETVVPQ
ncbi:hypothetical protein [Streptomyces californicus]|uniref:hypothetical protein n=1 Tax=Streptomyces californicus TaxID=67351 RepID=UPI00296EDA54|nr:hypothetical protein [Streptomyces californicus]MDW4916270.1 hypothetical protein [Streptomyces californicus]